MRKDYKLERRKYVIGGIVLVIACIYVVRLFSLQVLNDDYKQHADGNAFLKKTQYPSRGLIYDRNGKHRRQITFTSRKNIQVFPFAMKLFFLCLLRHHVLPLLFMVPGKERMFLRFLFSGMLLALFPVKIFSIQIDIDIYFCFRHGFL